MAFNGQPPDHIKPSRKIVLVMVLSVAILGLVSMLGYSKFIAFVQDNAAYDEGVALLQTNSVARAILGESIKVDSMISGNIRTDKERGEADYSLAVSGSKCAGTLFLHGEKLNNCWALTLWALESDCTNSPLILRNPSGQHIQDDTSQAA